MHILIEPQFRQIELSKPLTFFMQTKTPFFECSKIVHVEKDGVNHSFAIFHARIIGAN
jgi:hypothetical protein